MSGKYDDIIDLPHHVSSDRPHMALEERAKQFAPFAALKGYEEAIREKQKVKEDEVLLTDYSKAIIDGKLKGLSKGMEVEITYFDRKERKSQKISGKLVRISPQDMLLQIEERTIPFDDILVVV